MLFVIISNVANVVERDVTGREGNSSGRMAARTEKLECDVRVEAGDSVEGAIAAAGAVTQCGEGATRDLVQLCASM